MSSSPHWILSVLPFQVRITTTVVTVVLAFGLLGAFSALASASPVCKCGGDEPTTEPVQVVRKTGSHKRKRKRKGVRTEKIVKQAQTQGKEAFSF